MENYFQVMLEKIIPRWSLWSNLLEQPKLAGKILRQLCAGLEPDRWVECRCWVGEHFDGEARERPRENQHKLQT